MTELRSCDYGPRPLPSPLTCFIEAVLYQASALEDSSYIAGLLTVSPTLYQHPSLNVDLTMLIGRRSMSWKLDV